MKVGEKYVVEIDEIIEGHDGIRLAKIKGFNSLVFDKNGLDKLEKVDEDAANELSYQFGMEDGWKLAQRVAETTVEDLNVMGFEFNPDLIITSNSYELSCNAILTNDVQTAKKLFEHFDRRNADKLNCAVHEILKMSREEIDNIPYHDDDPEYNKAFTEIVLSNFLKLKNISE